MLRQSTGRSDKLHATASEIRVERVVGRDLDGPTGGMALVWRLIAAFRLGIRLGFFNETIKKVKLSLSFSLL